MICAPHRAQSAAASTAAADTRTLRQRYLYYKTADGCKGGWARAQHTPAGRTANGVAVSQPIQWSSEYHDTELALIYYKTPDGCKGGWTCAQHAPRRGETTKGCRRINYRYYNPTGGRWTRRDPIGIEGGINLYNYTFNKLYMHDVLGHENASSEDGVELNYSAFPKPSYSNLFEIWTSLWNNIMAAFKADYESKDPKDFKPNCKLQNGKCIKRLRVIMHGGTYQSPFGDKEVTAQWGNTLLSEGKDIKLISNQFSNILFCKQCTLELLACHLGESEYLKERLKENTGCTVVLYTGRVNAFFPF